MFFFCGLFTQPATMYNNNNNNQETRNAADALLAFRKERVRQIIYRDAHHITRVRFSTVGGTTTARVQTDRWFTRSRHTAALILQTALSTKSGPYHAFLYDNADGPPTCTLATHDECIGAMQAVGPGGAIELRSVRGASASVPRIFVANSTDMKTTRLSYEFTLTTCSKREMAQFLRTRLAHVASQPARNLRA